MSTPFVILDDFRGHVHRSASQTIANSGKAIHPHENLWSAPRSLHGPLILSQDLRCTEVNELDDAHVVQQNICGASASAFSGKSTLTIRFDVSMNNAMRMQIRQTFQHLHRVDLNDTFVFNSSMFK